MKMQVMKASKSRGGIFVPLLVGGGGTHKACFEIRAACYRIEKLEIQKIAGEGAGKSAAKTRGAGGSAARVLRGGLSLERKEEQHPRQHSLQHPEFSQHSPQHPPQLFSGFPRFSQEGNISPKSKFLGRISRGHPGVIRADIPAQNFGQGAQNPGKKKTSIWARTSMTRRRGRPRP